MAARATLLALSFCCACSDETAIRLVVGGDLEPGAQLVELDVATYRQGAETSSRTYSIDREARLPLVFRVPPASKDDEAVDLVVAGHLADGSRLTVTRGTTFVRGREITVELCLWAACVGSEAVGCLEGRCDLEATGGDAGADADLDAELDATADVGSDADRRADGDGDAEVDRCSDGLRDDDETDVDCGGERCSPCPDMSACRAGSDCASGLCIGAVCAAESCANGLHDSGESDTDCGGTTGCAPCPDLRTCSAPSDCESATCTDGLCGTASCVDFGTDSYGYRGCSFTPESSPCPDIRETGAPITPDADGAFTVPIGFDFDFYGIPNASVGVNTNGGLVFVRGRISRIIECFPVYVAPEHFVAAFWDDLIFREGSSMRYETVGTAPNRSFVVRWDVEHRRVEGNRLEFTAVLMETTSDVVVCYHDTSVGDPAYDGGAQASIGLNGSDDHVLQFSCMADSVTDGLVTLYLHP